MASSGHVRDHSALPCLLFREPGADRVEAALAGARAEAAGLLQATTRSAGLSLGDRCYLALASSLGAPAVTTDRAWARLDCGVAVELVR